MVLADTYFDVGNEADLCYLLMEALKRLDSVVDFVVAVVAQ